MRSQYRINSYVNEVVIVVACVKQSVKLGDQGASWGHVDKVKDVVLMTVHGQDASVVSVSVLCKVYANDDVTS